MKSMELIKSILQNKLCKLGEKVNACDAITQYLGRAYRAGFERLE